MIAGILKQLKVRDEEASGIFNTVEALDQRVKEEKARAEEFLEEKLQEI